MLVTSNAKPRRASLASVALSTLLYEHNRSLFFQYFDHLGIAL